MLKEEKELRKLLKEGVVMYDAWMKIHGNRKLSRLITAFGKAVQEDCAKVEVAKYSGELSRPFWGRVNSFRGNEKVHNRLYKLGCDLQNLEGKVLREIAAAIKGSR